MLDERDEKLDALFALARQSAPDTSTLEPHFETRLMARLAERKSLNLPWHRMVWRMVPAFAALTALMLVCNFTLNPARKSDPFAAITDGRNEQMTRNYLLGE
jgi:hypothetical protein